MTCAQTLPLGSQSWSSFQLEAGRSRHSHRVLTLWKSAGFFTVSNLSLRICMTESPRDGACFPDQHTSHRSLSSAYWMNQTNKWRSDWMDVCEKKVSERKHQWIHKWIRKWRDPLSPRGFSRHPGAMPAKSAPGKLHYNLYKHFLFYYKHASGCEVVSYCDLDLWLTAFPWWFMVLNIFSCAY